MLKPVIAATAILAIAGSSIVYAQQRSGDHGGFDRGRGEHHHRLSPDDFSALADARIAALKAGLELTPDQQKNWPAFETALRNMAQLRLQRLQARQAADQQQQQQQQQTTPATPFDRMQRRADTMSKTGAALKQIADSGAPLYASLNDAQKGRFTMLARILRPHERDHAANDGRNGSGHEGRRFGRNEQDGQGRGDNWGRGRRFGENDQDGQGFGHRHHFDQDGRGPGMHNLSGSGTDTNQDSQL